MAVSGGNIILFFTSSDLLHWETSGGFGLTFGATCGVWETPDLFPLPVDGGPDSRWVLAVAIGGCAPAGGSGMQYFVGSFDGQTFTSDDDKDTILWADFGADFYAPQSWSEEPDGRRLWLAWMNNWTYAQDIPASTWRGGFTVPRELTLVTTPEGVRLTQQPIAELQQLRGRQWQWRDEVIEPDSDLLDEVSGQTLEIVAEFAMADLADADRFGFRLRTGDGEYTTVGYATKARTLYVDRAQSGDVAFNTGFGAVHTATMEPLDGLIRLHILVDRSSVEVFGNDGRVVFTEQIFPAGDSLGLELFLDGRQVTLNTLDIWQLEPATFRVADR
jgi:sucrose-6-phosphate hydrolase SacC (GH32 family)